jgi:hypothetical protein
VARELGGEQHCRRGFADTPFGACEHNGWHITSLLNIKSGSAPYPIATRYSSGIDTLSVSFLISERYWLATGYLFGTS